MAYLIVRLEPMSNRDKPVRDCSPPVAQLVKRHRLRQPHVRDVTAFMDSHGYELGPVVGRLPGGIAAWPLLALVYVSPNKDGVGRTSSQLARWPARRKT